MLVTSAVGHDINNNLVLLIFFHQSAGPYGLVTFSFFKFSDMFITLD